MTLEQAMDVLIKVTGEFRGTRTDHDHIRKALETIHKALFPKEEKECQD